MTAEFYVYEHIRASDGEVFYIGKGTNARSKVSCGRTNYWTSVANKHGWVVNVLRKCCSENEERGL